MGIESKNKLTIINLVFCVIALGFAFYATYSSAHRAGYDLGYSKALMGEEVKEAVQKATSIKRRSDFVEFIENGYGTIVIEGFGKTSSESLENLEKNIAIAKSNSWGIVGDSKVAKVKNSYRSYQIAIRFPKSN